MVPTLLVSGWAESAPGVEGVGYPRSRLIVMIRLGFSLICLAPSQGVAFRVRRSFGVVSVLLVLLAGAGVPA